MTDTEQAQQLTTELHNVAEQLAASTEARLMMADTIADLRTENATLRAALKDALAEIARLRYGTRFQAMTDRGESYATTV